MVIPRPPVFDLDSTRKQPIQLSSGVFPIHPPAPLAIVPIGDRGQWLDIPVSDDGDTRNWPDREQMRRFEGSLARSSGVEESSRPIPEGRETTGRKLVPGCLRPPEDRQAAGRQGLPGHPAVPN